MTTLTETPEETPVETPMFVLTGEADVRVVVESDSEDREFETVMTVAAGSEMPDGPTTKRVPLEEEDEEEEEEEEEEEDAEAEAEPPPDTA